MFLWPFIVAGTLLLTTLNPPYSAILVLRSVPRRSQLLLSGSTLLARQAADVSLLAQSPWMPRCDHRYRPALPAPQDKNASTALIASEPVSPAFADPPITPVPWTWALLPNKRDLVLLLLQWCPLRVSAQLCLWGFILWSACWIIIRLRAPQPSSPALEFVESLHKEIRGQAFTPSTSFDSCESSSEHSDEESDIVPAVCGLAILDGTIFVPKAALDTVPAVPLRLNILSPPHCEMDEVDLLQVASLTKTSKVASCTESEDTRTTLAEAPSSYLEVPREEAHNIASLAVSSVAPPASAQRRNKPRLPMVLLRRNNEEPSARSRTTTSPGAVLGAGRRSGLRSQVSQA